MRKKIVIIILLVLLLPIAIFLSFEQIEYLSLVSKARDAFEQSRADPSWVVGSYEFETQGITYGMTEEQVDQILGHAYKILRNEITDINTITFNKYEFRKKGIYLPIKSCLSEITASKGITK